MKTFKTYIAEKSAKKKKRFLKKSDYAVPDLDLSKLYTLDDIKRSHDPDEVYVSPDASMIVAKKIPRLRVESFSQHLCNAYYEKYLKPQL